VAEPLAQPAAARWVIGEIPFEGTEADGRWVRYERAVEHVLGHAPLHAICAYARSSVGEPWVREAIAAHGPLDGPEPTTAARWAVQPPPTAPAISARDASPAEVRRRLVDVLGPDAPALADAQLVVTELMSNGTRHGREPVDTRVWATAGQVVLEVSDAGDGLRDPLVDLRPLRGGRNGGYGLWLVGQIADALSIERLGGRTVVTAVLSLDPDPVPA
jgi:anti-sigma regulatory factor (Ser/Thr protein kinase)